ncbi:MAG: hypothetical protein LWX11_08740 [Firmicutes bacterium]|nr:hypothetical protein [Bacillota bacterium]
MRPVLWKVPVLVGSALAAQAPMAEDPLSLPEEAIAFARRITGSQNGTKPKLQAFLSAVFRPVEEGGLGMVYDNTRTRTAAEVWKERKANCLSLTAFYVASCQGIHIDAQYAEALNTNRWRREGSLIRMERHLVALVQLPPLEDVVADFLPQLRRRVGLYRVSILSRRQVTALFFSNRAVEELDRSNPDQAMVMAQRALATDNTLSVGWNILGVVQRHMGEDVKAEESFRKALACDGRDSFAIGNMEGLMRAQGRLEDAQRFRELGQEVRKKDPYFNAFLAEEALERGESEESVRLVNRAIKLFQYEPEFHLLRARAHITLGRVKEALRDLEAAHRWASPAEQARYAGKLNALRNTQE